MKNSKKISFIIVTALSLLCFLVVLTFAAPKESIPPDSRCSVCGMFVAKYPNWITQIRHSDNSLQSFDGVKDMMVYFFNPTKYGSLAQDTIRHLACPISITKIQWQ